MTAQGSICDTFCGRWWIQSIPVACISAVIPVPAAILRSPPRLLLLIHIVHPFVFMELRDAHRMVTLPHAPLPSTSFSTLSATSDVLTIRECQQLRAVSCGSQRRGKR